MLANIEYDDGSYECQERKLGFGSEKFIKVLIVT